MMKSQKLLPTALTVLSLAIAAPCMAVQIDTDPEVLRKKLSTVINNTNFKIDDEVRLSATSALTANGDLPTIAGMIGIDFKDLRRTDFLDKIFTTKYLGLVDKEEVKQTSTLAPSVPIKEEEKLENTSSVPTQTPHINTEKFINMVNDGKGVEALGSVFDKWAYKLQKHNAKYNLAQSNPQMNDLNNALASILNSTAQNLHNQAKEPNNNSEDKS